MSFLTLNNFTELRWTDFIQQLIFMALLHLIYNHTVFVINYANFSTDSDFTFMQTIVIQYFLKNSNEVLVTIKNVPRHRIHVSIIFI